MKLNQALALGISTLLAACSAPGSGLSSPAGPAAQTPASSWAKPDASALLYVSDPNGGVVAMYSYPVGKPAGQIANFYSAGGMCVSPKTGNVFIADQSNGTVRVYPHGATKPIRTLADPGYTPLGCAVDPVTGNLAVTSYIGSKKNGSLAIYTRAMGTPKIFSDVNIPHMFYCGYDSAGNLYLDGITSKRVVVLGELPKGGAHVAMVQLDQAIATAGGVQWDGTNVAVGDVSAGIIYRFKIAAGKGTKAGSTPLKGSAFVQEFWIAGQQVVAPDFTNGVVRFYKYPAGGAAVKTISGFTGPVATTISP